MLEGIPLCSMGNAAGARRVQHGGGVVQAGNNRPLWLITILPPTLGVFNG